MGIPKGVYGGNSFFKYTVVDPIHDWVRLTNSLHSWYDENNKLVVRRVFQMSPNDFKKWKLKGILRIANDCL